MHACVRARVASSAVWCAFDEECIYMFAAAAAASDAIAKCRKFDYSNAYIDGRTV